MQVKIREVVYLELDNGKCPFEEWLDKLKDSKMQFAVYARLTRIRDGNFGDHKSVGDGVCELRIPKGPGLRIYYGLKGDELVILLGGGDKKSQRKDIANAKEIWRKYKSEN